jgi:hypothetical protein
MKAVLNIVAAVLIAAGLVVAVASLLTPGQVILGIDFKLAATLVVGGLILHALARVVALLERMGTDLRQLRKAGSEEPPWLRQAAGKYAQAMGPGALPVVAAAEEEEVEVRSAYPAERDQDLEEEAAMPAEGRWPAVSEVQWPDADDLRPPKHQPAATPAQEDEAEEPLVAEAEAEAELEPVPEPQPEVEHRPEPEPQPLGPAQMAVPGEAETSVAAAEVTETTSEPEAPEASIEGEDDFAGEPPSTQFHAEVPSRLRPSRDERLDIEEPADEEIIGPAPVAADEQAPAEEEQPELYVVEERMFRGKQARVLSDGTIEAETAEGWMRFEDFDHLEEYLEAMAEMGR